MVDGFPRSQAQVWPPPIPYMLSASHYPPFQRHHLHPNLAVAGLNIVLNPRCLRVYLYISGVCCALGLQQAPDGTGVSRTHR